MATLENQQAIQETLAPGNEGSSSAIVDSSIHGAESIEDQSISQSNEADEKYCRDPQEEQRANATDGYAGDNDDDDVSTNLKARRSRQLSLSHAQTGYPASGRSGSISPRLSVAAPTTHVSKHDIERTAEKQTRPLFRSLLDDLIDISRLPHSVPEVSIAQKRKGTVSLLHSLQYTTLTDRRLRSLEGEVKMLKKERKQREQEGQTQPFAPPESGSHIRERLIPGIKEARYEEFLVHESTTKHVITYLCDDTPGWNGSDELSNRSCKVSRVCVNSNIIRTWLAEILPAGSKPNDTNRIFMAPFKPFCLFEQQIREHLTSLEHERDRRAGEEASEPSKDVGLSANETVSSDAPVSVNTTTITTDTSHSDETQQALLEPNHVQESVNRTKSPVPGAETEPASNVQPLEAIIESIEHFQALIELFDTELKGAFEIHKRLRHGKPNSVQFFDLWHLFRPGQVVVTEDETKQAFVVLNVRGGRPLYETPTESSDEDSEPERRRVRDGQEGRRKRFKTRSNVSPFKVDCVYLDFDGKNFGPVSRTFRIDYYHGEQEVSQLEIVPIRLAKMVAGQSRQEYLVNRGRRFEALAHSKPSHHEYEGTSLVEKSENGTKSSREQIDSHVIIDLEHAYLADYRKPQFSLLAFQGRRRPETPDPISGQCQCSPDCEDEHGLIHIDDGELDRVEREKYLDSSGIARMLRFLNGEHHILLPNYVYGYVLRNLEWYRLDIDLVKAVDQRKRTNFKDLVLPDRNRNLIEALVHARQSGHAGLKRGGQFDLVRGKGQGTIILLHGVPGTGKSSTAECVAEHLQCPLFAITCGNIGTQPMEVEESLRNMFYLAHKWNCVMLLDEADVFLQTRDERDMSRNAVVSVFLRSLEYYSGILFLTTNKVGAFDEAFVSRIHMSLYYPTLDESMTAKIWEVNLRRTKELRPHIEFDELALMDFGRTHFQKQQYARSAPWNGRQIRNAFQTATALAEFEAESRREKDNTQTSQQGQHAGTARARLSERHFIEVARVSEDFNDYLRRTHKGDFTSMAASRQYRHNDSATATATRATFAKPPRPVTPSNYANSGFGPHTSYPSRQQHQPVGRGFGGSQPPEDRYDQWPQDAERGMPPQLASGHEYPSPQLYSNTDTSRLVPVQPAMNHQSYDAMYNPGQPQGHSPFHRSIDEGQDMHDSPASHRQQPSQSGRSSFEDYQLRQPQSMSQQSPYRQ